MLWWKEIDICVGWFLRKQKSMWVWYLYWKVSRSVWQQKDDATFIWLILILIRLNFLTLFTKKPFRITDNSWYHILCKWKSVVVAQIIWMILSSTMRDMSTLECRLLLDPSHPLLWVVVESSPSLAMSWCWILLIPCYELMLNPPPPLLWTVACFGLFLNRFEFLLNPPHPLLWFLSDSSHPLFLVIKYAICTWMFPKGGSRTGAPGAPPPPMKKKWDLFLYIFTVYTQILWF